MARVVRGGRSWRRVARVVAMAAVGTVLVAACSAGTDDESRTPTTEAPGPDAATTEPGSIGQLFSLIPDTPDARQRIRFSNVALAQEAGGIPIEAGDELADQVQRFQSGEGLAGPVWPGCRSYLADGRVETEAELGFSAADLAGTIDAGELPAAYCALVGEFDPTAVASAVSSDPGYSDIVEEVETATVPFYRWGVDGAQNLLGSPEESATAARPDGRGGRLYVSDGLIYWNFFDATMQASISTGVSGGNESLGDSSDLGALARMLDAAGMYGGELTAMVPVDAAGICGSDCADAAVGAVADSYELASGANTIGLAWGSSQSGDPVAMLIIVSSEPQLTQENLDAVAANLANAPLPGDEGAWADEVTVIDQTGDGQIGLLLLEPAPDASASSPGLFLHELFVQGVVPIGNDSTWTD